MDAQDIAILDEAIRAAGHSPGDAGAPPPHPLSVGAWLVRHIPPPDFLLGELLSTTTRAMLVGTTGLGKTMFAMELAFAMALGKDFLHWRPHNAARVLYIDGEMASYDIKERLEGSVKRWNGEVPENLFIVCRGALDDKMMPLNSRAGQLFIDRYIAELGGIDFIIFDNIQGLTVGDQRGQDPWSQVQPWALELTRRHIGQLWVHHSGWNAEHGYGDSTREWQMNTVMMMKNLGKPGSSPKFKLEFKKARGRKARNWSDFQATIIELKGDVWSGTPVPDEEGKDKAPVRDRLFTLLCSAANIDPPADLNVPQGRKCITEGELRQKFEEAERRARPEVQKETIQKSYRAAMKDLRGRGAIGEGRGFVWDDTTS